jgi:chromate transport protein ChrA
LILIPAIANHFGALTSSLFNTTIFGSLYIAVIALVFNLIISFGGSAIINRKERLAVIQNKK